jgi:nicotinamidase-related amidase
VTTFDREAAGRRLRLTPSQAALLVVDVQERLAAAMPPEVMNGVIKNIRTLVHTAEQLKIPVFASEQYPKGLGCTVPAVQESLERVAKSGVPVHRWEKIEFSAVVNDAFAKLDIPRVGERPAYEQWIVCGLEAHVCIYQSVRDITGWGATVHVVGDATASRKKANWLTGLELARDAGALVTSTETCVFDLLGKAGSPAFKAISQAIK